MNHSYIYNYKAKTLLCMLCGSLPYHQELNPNTGELITSKNQD